MVIIKKGRTMMALGLLVAAWGAVGCTVKAVGDPNRPITINAHVTVDIRGLKDTASDIEDFVSGSQTNKSLPVKGE